MHDTDDSTFPLVRSLSLRARDSCPAEFNLDHVRRFLSYPAWNGFLKLVSYTRSYNDGLRIAALLLDYIEQHRALFTPKEVAACEPLLYLFGKPGDVSPVLQSCRRRDAGHGLSSA
jgi:hypothetical protein